MDAYLEIGESLSILPGVPRAWLEDGKTISVDGIASYFSKVSIKVDSDVSVGKISVSVKVDGAPDRLPKKLAVRVPHPQRINAFSVSMGNYDSSDETVTINSFKGKASFDVNF